MSCKYGAVKWIVVRRGLLRTSLVCYASEEELSAINVTKKKWGAPPPSTRTGKVIGNAAGEKRQYKRTYAQMSFISLYKGLNLLKLRRPEHSVTSAYTRRFRL